MNMRDKMKEKAIPASSTIRSKKIVKTISRADTIVLNRTMKPIIEQNKKERRESLESVKGKNWP